MNKREIELKRLGFTLEGESWYTHKWGNQYWMDSWCISDYTNQEWSQYIEDVKKDFKTSEIEYKSQPEYLAGVSAVKKNTQKIFKGILNKLKSNLKQEQSKKLDKRQDLKKEMYLTARIEVLTELEKKLCG